MPKNYKCPYCGDGYSREDLVSHIEEEHDELIPEESTPVHLVFDIVNSKKPIGNAHGVCVVCKRDTPWSDKNNKYQRLCGRQKCNDTLREIYSKNMIPIHGTDNLLNDAMRQEKMLAGRKISGKYRFTDNGFHIYTGSYEKNALEFEDKVLGFKSSEILSPGPIIEYEYKGEVHKYITDQLIIPFNLIIEVKDGGNNANNRINDDSRDRTIAKELAITKMGKYNYLRLVNNDFSQLLETLAELKSQMLDDSEDNKKVIININEEVEALEESSYGKDISLATPLELNKLLNTFEYGMLDSHLKETNDPLKYRTISPKDFIKAKCGTCWDYAEFEASYFKDIFSEYYKFTDKKLTDGEYSLYFMQQDNGADMPTHTWLAYMDDGEVLVLESAWGEMQGINDYDSEDRMIKAYTSKLNPDNNKFILLKYKPSTKFGLSTEQYLNSMYKNGKEIINTVEESAVLENITDIIFYHASDKELNTITPTSPNMGNKLEPAKWCCYLWKDKDRAIMFGVQKALRSYRSELKNNGNAFSSIVYDVTNGRSMLSESEYDDIKHKVLKAKLSAYVHTVEAPLSTLGIGHATSIPEYTSTKELPVLKVEKIDIDSKIFDYAFEKGNDDDKKKLLDLALHSKARGVLAFLMHDQVETYKKEMKIKKLMKSGELSIGDDISIISVDESAILEDAIDTRQFEFIASPGEVGGQRCNNAVIRIQGKQYRARVETIIIKDGKIYAQKLDTPNKYGYGCKFPGGGIEPNISVEKSAEEECNEEARINVDELKYTGINYLVDFNGEYPKWHKEKLWPIGLRYEGSLCYIFVAYYDSQYKGTVDEIDYDDLFKHGKFYDISELDLLPEHIQALKKDGLINESKTDECGGGPGGMVGTADLSLVSQYGYKNSESDEVEGYAVHNDILTDSVITLSKKGKVKKESSSFLEGRKIRMFQYVGENSLAPIINAIGKRAYREFFYEALTGKKLLSDDQILCDECFKEISPTELNESKNSKVQTIFAEYREVTGDPIKKFPLMGQTDILEAEKLIGSNSDIKIFENVDGYFAENMVTGHRTGYYNKIGRIQIGAIKC